MKDMTTECDQVLHRNVIGQLQPVGAGHRDIAVSLQHAQQRRHETVALAHQNKNIARRDGPKISFFVSNRFGADP